MQFKPKKSVLLLIGVLSLVCSRVIFLFLNDPEGPNLLVVLALAALLSMAFLTIYYLSTRTRAVQKG